MATNKRRRVDDDENATAAASDGTMVPPTTPATTTSAGGGTPGGVKVKPGDSSGSEGTLVGTNVPVGKQSETNAAAATKKRRVGWNQEATALGYEAGTIKNSAFVLLAQSGTAGMTVAAIVDAATKQGLYSWGTCKTPNNSVTAALSQDTTFVRIAPSTYALRSTLKGGAGPVPQPRTSSGSINSGLGRHGAASGSGLSGGAVAGGRSTLGQKAISSKARRVDRAQQQMRGFGSDEFAGGNAGHGRDESERGYDEDEFEASFQPGPANHAPHVVGAGYQHTLHSGYNDDANVFGYGTTTSTFGSQHNLYGNAAKISSALQMESYRRRMDIGRCGLGAGGEGELMDDEDGRGGFGGNALPPTQRPTHAMTTTTAGSSLLWYPTANQHTPPTSPPSPLGEPTEALIRASSWKDEAKSLFASPGVGDFEQEAGLSAIGSGHLPRWVLESFGNGEASPGAIAC